MMDLRNEFMVDCLFGMPGVPGEAGSMARNPDGTFNRKVVETTFQIWARGHQSCTIDVRNFFESRKELSADFVLHALRSAGLAAQPAGG
jgi:hypothetical protein